MPYISTSSAFRHSNHSGECIICCRFSGSGGILPAIDCCLDSFNDWGERGCNKYVPVLGGDGTKIAPTGDIFDQPPGGMSSIRGKLADRVGDHVVVSPEGAVLVTSPGTESSYPRPLQSLNNSLSTFTHKAIGAPPSHTDLLSSWPYSWPFFSVGKILCNSAPSTFVCTRRLFVHDDIIGGRFPPKVIF